MSLLAKLPLCYHYFWGDLISWYMKKVHKYRYDVIMINLSRAFPNFKYKKLTKIADDFYRHFGEIFAETIWFRGTNYKKLAKSNICEITNPEILEEAYKSSPSVEILFSHCGNWELMGGMVPYTLKKMSDSPIGEDNTFVVYKKLRSDFWNEIMIDNRQAPLHDFKGQIESKQILRFALKNRHNKGVYLIINDQFPYDTKVEIGNFMNQPTKAMMGSITLAHKLGMSVVYMGMKHIERGKYELTYTKISDDASKDDPKKLLRDYFDLLEKDINECPYNWLWSHRRWK